MENMDLQRGPHCMNTRKKKKKILSAKKREELFFTPKFGGLWYPV